MIEYYISDLLYLRENQTRELLSRKLHIPPTTIRRSRARKDMMAIDLGAYNGIVLRVSAYRFTGIGWITIDRTIVL